MNITFIMYAAICICNAVIRLRFYL